MTLSPEPTMPPGLEDFPWANIVHMWDYAHYGPGFRLTLWYPESAHPEYTHVTVSFIAYAEHLAVLAWLTARFEILEMPSFETLGTPVTRDGVQEYERVAFVGAFTVGAVR